MGRLAVSLSGLPSQLIALGGYNGVSLKICEQYSVSANKWSELAPLNTARSLPGSVLLPSKRAFCFCGSQTFVNFLNSVETIQMKSDSEWKTLPLSDRVAKI